MKLSTIIVNYNSGAMTAACIESLVSQLPTDHEIIVVDNASRDDSVPFLQSDFPEVKVITNDTNRGFGAAVNQGIAESIGEYYLVLNPDIIALPGSIKTLLSFMDAHQDVGLSGGKLLYPNGRLQYSCFRFYTPWTVIARRTFFGRTKFGQREINRFLMKDTDHTSTLNVEWLMGSCLCLRASAVERVGRMDERFFLYFEDVDWARRFWEKNWRVVYVPKAHFSHFYQQTSRRSPLFGVLTNWATRAHIKSAIQYFWKYRGRSLPLVTN